jgi:hypothetical protein
MPNPFGYATLSVALQTTPLQGPNPAINEGSACFVTAAYFDSTNKPFIPAAVHWRLDDATGGAVVVNWMGIVPMTTNIVTVSGAQNAMLSLTRLSEVRQFTVAVTDSQQNVVNATVQYQVLRVQGLG